MAGSAARVLDSQGVSLRESPVELPGQLRLLDVGKLEPNPWNPNEQDAETFAKEKVSLQRFGFVAPIIARPHPKERGRWEIIDGEHRWKGAIELKMLVVPVYDVGPIGDHEAQQLTVILNELRGKPNEKKLEVVLKRLLGSDTLDRLTEVMPLTKEQYAKAAKLPGFDWESFAERTKQSAPKWVERIFRMSVEGAAALGEALADIKGDSEMSDAQALEALAKEYLGHG